LEFILFSDANFMTDYKLISEFQDALVSIYKEQNLKCLRGFERNSTLNGRNIGEWYHEATRKCAARHEGRINYFKMLDDILFCSDALLFFTGHLFLYRPFINNPLEDAYRTKDITTYPNLQEIPSKRYSMYADSASQQAYNYWGRIGNLIASFFPDRLKSKDVLFASAIDAVPTEYQEGENYTWLKDFKQREYLELNKKRRQIVHYTSSDTEYKDKHLKIVHDKEAIIDWQTERENLAEYFKNHITLTLTGFEKTLLFFEEITPKIFPEII